MSELSVSSLAHDVLANHGIGYKFTNRGLLDKVKETVDYATYGAIADYATYGAIAGLTSKLASLGILVAHDTGIKSKGKTGKNIIQYEVVDDVANYKTSLVRKGGRVKDSINKKNTQYNPVIVDDVEKLIENRIGSDEETTDTKFTEDYSSIFPIVFRQDEIQYLRELVKSPIDVTLVKVKKHLEAGEYKLATDTIKDVEVAQRVYQKLLIKSVS